MDVACEYDEANLRKPGQRSRGIPGGMLTDGGRGAANRPKVFTGSG